MFAILTERVFPWMLGNRTLDDPVRLWGAGYSSGKEVCSMEMAYPEFFVPMATRIPLQIFWTDIDEAMLDRACSGRFTRSQVQEL